ncbi:MAG: molybdenum cofactor biosynthesis protein MoaE [Planctomycetota bacterium]|nr:MAG: molybdenum cofactor biosynthesis protein MoaE [Planctomycetota bacterium]
MTEGTPRTLPEPLLHVSLTEQPIDYTALTERVRSHRAGAVVTFLGTVREFTAGRRTLALDYEAYEPMARAELQRILAEATEQWPLVAAVVEHRLGRLELGEISVAVAVAAPHRRDAFQAAQYVMDQTKRRVPIWKRENWADGGTEWVHPPEGMPQRPGDAAE